MLRTAFFLIVSTLMAASLCAVRAADLPAPDARGLAEVFRDAEAIDLRASTVPSVVKLRDTVGIPAPSTPVLVKTFDRKSLPGVLRRAFRSPNALAVTISGRYIAVLRTEFPKEYDDLLSHELVHAYISLASPKPLPFWFQEGSAVHFSTDKGRKFYGQPSKDQVGVMEGHVVDLSPTYKQKLQSFHYMIETAGEEKFQRWYRNAVTTGVVDPRTLLGLKSAGAAEPVSNRAPAPVWLWAAIGLVVLGVLIAGYLSTRQRGEFY